MEKFVLIADPIDYVCRQILKEKYGLTVIYHPDIKPAYLKNALHKYDGLIVRSRTTVDRQMIDLGAYSPGKLKVIGRAGMGLDNIDLEAANDVNVKVLNVTDGHIPSVAEHTIGLMIALSRNLVEANNSTKAGKWEKSKFKGNELYGKSLGIIGYGQIGQHVAKITEAMGMDIFINDPYYSGILGYGNFVSLQTMFLNCDFITIHVPLNLETENLISFDLLNVSKSSLKIINTSRGKIINEPALVEALLAGTISGAALDVFSEEPLYGSPLLSFKNVIATPHIASSTVEAQYRIAEKIAHKIGKYLI